MATATLAEQARELKEAEEHENLKEAIQRKLAEYVGRTVNTSSAVVFHTEPPNKYSLPKGTTLDKAAKDLMSEAKAQTTKTRTNRDFNCRIEDGLVAMHRVMERVFGAVGRGITHYSFFGGEHPPERMSVTIGMDKAGRKKHLSVAASEIEFSWLDATIEVDVWSSPEDPQLMRLTVEHLVKNQDAVDGFLAMVEDEFTQNSIYKGHILEYQGRQGGTYSLNYVHRRADPTIVYNTDVNNALRKGVWGRMQRQEILRQVGARTSFKALVYGPLGTGKSEALITSSIIARDCGRTVIEYKPTSADSIDELIRVVNVARRYGPSVIVIEDFDRFFSDSMPAMKLSTLTNLFDGADKTDEISILMTTNHIRNIKPEMTRAGRLTAQIEIGPLDKEAIAELLKISLGEQLREDTDFEAVWEVVKDFSPAFIKSTFEDARDFSIIDTGELNLPLGTEDLIVAAQSKMSQAKLHEEMTRKDVPVRTIDDELRDMIKETLSRMAVDLNERPAPLVPVR